MLRSVIVFALLLAVGGCAGGLGAPSAEASKTIQQARTVGVISAVGHKISLQKIGITVFGNELNEVATGSWGIDDAVATRVGAVLSKRFTVRRIGVPQGAFAAYEGGTDGELQGIEKLKAATRALVLDDGLAATVSQVMGLTKQVSAN